MTPIDSTNDQNTVRRVILDYMHTLTIKLHINEKLKTVLSSLLCKNHLRNLEGRNLNLLGKECIVWQM